MNKLNKLKEIWSFLFVKYLAGLFFIITVSSLVLVFVNQTIFKSDENKQLVREVNSNQKQEFLKSLQTFSNVYVLLQETNLDSDLIEDKFFNLLKFNPNKVQEDWIVSPLILNQNDWDLNLNFVLKQREESNTEKKTLFSNFNSKTIKKYFEDKEYWLNLKKTFNSLLAVSKGNATSLDFFIKSAINNSDFNVLIFSFLKKGLNFLMSDKFVEHLQFFKKNVLDWNYTKLLSNFIKVFKTKNYQKNAKTKLDILINNLILAQNLKLEKDLKFQEFLNDTFGLKVIDQIIIKLKKDSFFKNKIETELNQLDRDRQLNLKVREKIFQTKTKVFVKNFVSKLFFQLENKNFDLMTFGNVENETTSTKQKTNDSRSILNFFVKLVKKNQFEEILELFFYLFFFDYLINQEKNMPTNFHDILDSFMNFLQKSNFSSIQFGYFIDGFIKSFKEMLIKPIEFQNFKLQDAKKMILNWIESGLSKKNKIFKQETKIDHDNVMETSSITVGEIQKVLKGDNVLGNISKELKLWFNDLKNLEKVFKKLFEKSNIHVLIRKAFDPKFISLTGKFIFNSLQKTKDVFFGKNMNKIKQLKHFVFNWELNELDEKKIMFTPEKQNEEKKLREKIENKMENFITQRNSLVVTEEEGHFQKLISSQGQEQKWDHEFASKLINKDLVELFEAILDWMQFSWNNFLITLPFFDLNILIFTFFQFFSTNSDLAKKISFFDDLSNKKFISGVLNTLFELLFYFLKGIKETDIDWQTCFCYPRGYKKTDFYYAPGVSGLLASNYWRKFGYFALKYLIWKLGYLKNNFSEIPSILFFFLNKKDDKVLELQNLSSSKKLFRTNSFLEKIIAILNNNDQLTENEKQFLIFLNTKLSGEKSVFSQIINDIDQYLDENFYSYLNWNNWKYENIQMDNFDDFISQKNSLPLKISYTSTFERRGLKKIQHHLSWEIYYKDNERHTKLVSLERVKN